jgi:hypothetical protein
LTDEQARDDIDTGSSQKEMAMPKRVNVNDHLNRLAGHRHSPGRAQYAGDQCGESDLSSKVEDLLRAADLGALTCAQLDHLGRILAGGQAAAWDEVLRRSGCRRSPWQPRRGNPGVKEADFLRGINALWMDHPFVMRDRDGNKEFVSEPYELCAPALRQLVDLLDDGWNVRIKGIFSTHFPGRTMLVRIRKQKPRPKKEEQPCLS